jgi:hypothetical protein
MLKIRCENCTRLIVCEAVSDEGRSFCGFGCRLSWIRAMRRFQTARKAPILAAGDP